MKTTNNKFGKTLSLMVGLLIMGIFTLSSCSKDEGEDHLDDNDIGCSNCFTYANGGNPKAVKLDAVFYSISGDEMTLFFRGVNDEGILIYLETDNVFSGIPEGTFTGNGTTRFRRAIHMEEDGDNTPSVNAISRQISITKSGNNYKVSFDFTSGVGLTKGNYTGEISPIG